jgi:hypothetical protein
MFLIFDASITSKSSFILCFLLFEGAKIRLITVKSRSGKL